VAANSSASYSVKNRSTIASYHMPSVGHTALHVAPTKISSNSIGSIIVTFEAGSLSCRLYPIHATSASYLTSSTSWINAANHVFWLSKNASQTRSRWIVLSNTFWEFMRNFNWFWCEIILSLRASLKRSISSALTSVRVATSLSVWIWVSTFSSLASLRRCSCTVV